jgi:hypothetical protein
MSFWLLADFGLQATSGRLSADFLEWEIVDRWCFFLLEKPGLRAVSF